MASTSTRVGLMILYLLALRTQRWMDALVRSQMLVTRLLDLTQEEHVLLLNPLLVPVPMALRDHTQVALFVPQTLLVQQVLAQEVLVMMLVAIRIAEVCSVEVVSLIHLAGQAPAQEVPAPILVVIRTEVPCSVEVVSLIPRVLPAPVLEVPAPILVVTRTLVRRVVL